MVSSIVSMECNQLEGIEPYGNLPEVMNPFYKEHNKRLPQEKLAVPEQDTADEISKEQVKNDSKKNIQKTRTSKRASSFENQFDEEEEPDTKNSNVSSQDEKSIDENEIIRLVEQKPQPQTTTINHCSGQHILSNGSDPTMSPRLVQSMPPQTSTPRAAAISGMMATTVTTNRPHRSWSNYTNSTSLSETIHRMRQNAMLENQHSGWLWMRSSKFGIWRNRYFCLNGTMLSYFVTFPSEEFLKQASRNVFHFNEGTQPRGVLRVAHVDETHNRLGLKIYGACGKSIEVRASRSDIRDQWLRHLKPPARRMSRSWSIGQDLTIPQLSLASFDPEVTCTPERQSIPILKSGWLYKQSDVLKRWNRYYFVIQGKMVSYYASDKPYDVPRRRGYVYHVNGTRDGRGLLIKLDHDFVLHVRSSDLNDLEEWRECLLLCKPKLPLSVNQMPIPNPSPRTL